MKNIIVFGDLHLQNNVLDKYILGFIKSQIKEDDIIVFLGDIFDDFDIGCKNESFYKFISTLENQIFILLGNHDFSQGRVVVKIVNYFKSNIVVIPNYTFLDIDNYRLHFYNYFRYSRDIDFQLHSDKKNILFSHADLDPKNPLKGFSQFYAVFNGHIHDYSQNENIINVGSIRKTKINEMDDKSIHRLYLDDNNLKVDIINFKSIIDIQKYQVQELNDKLSFDRPTVLTVLFSGHEDKKEEIKKIKTYSWYDENKIVLREDLYKDDKVILESLNNVHANAKNLDVVEIFGKYIAYYIDKYKVLDINVDEYINLFKYFYEKNKNEISNFKINNLQFDSAEAKNFKLFEYIKFDLNSFNNEVVSIKGENWDELEDEKPSSNESGKSCLRQIFEYAFQGNDSGITNPLRRKTKSGMVVINFRDNDNKIEFIKKFNKNAYEIHINENGEPFYKEETNTNKLKLFFKKYSFLDALQFIFLSDNGFADKFFSSRGLDKFNIFKEIFPIIKYISDLVLFIKKEYGEEKKKYEDAKLNLEHKKEIRQREYLHIKEKLNDLKEIKINKNTLDLLELEITEESKNLDIPIYDKVQLENVYDVIQDEKDYILIKKIYDMDYDKVIEYFKLTDRLLYLDVDIKKSALKNFEINPELEKYDLNELYNSITEKYNQKIYESINKNLNVDKQVLKSIYYDSSEKEISILKEKVSDGYNELLKLKKKHDNIESDINKLKKGVEENKCNVCGSILNNTDQINKHIEIEQQKLDEIIKDGVEKQHVYNLESERLKNKISHFEKIEKLKSEYNDILNANGMSIDVYLAYDNNKVYPDNLEQLCKEKKEYEMNKMLYVEYNKLISEKEIVEEKLKNINYKIDFSREDYLKIYPSINKFKNVLKDINVENWKKEVEINLGKIYKYNQQIAFVNALKKEYEEEKELFDEFNLKRESIKQNISKIQKECSIREIRDIYKNLEVSYNRLDILYYILTGRGTTFEKYFINNFFSQVEEIYNVLLKFLFERKVELKISEMEFKFMDEDEECNYREFSSAGKIKLCLCLLLTLNIVFQEYGTDCNIQWIDEYLDSSLDDVNSGRVFNLIKSFYNNKKIFLVTHKPYFDEFINKTIKFVRKDGKSELEM